MHSPEIVTITHVPDNLPGICVPLCKYCGGHTNQRDKRGIRSLIRTIWLCAEDRRRLPAVHKLFQYAPVNMDNPLPLGPLIVIYIMTIPWERWVRVGSDQRGGHLFSYEIFIKISKKPAPAGVGRLILQYPVCLSGMSNDLMGEKGIEIGVGDYYHLFLSRPERFCIREGKRILCNPH